MKWWIFRWYSQWTLSHRTNTINEWKKNIHSVRLFVNFASLNNSFIIKIRRKLFKRLFASFFSVSILNNRPATFECRNESRVNRENVFLSLVLFFHWTSFQTVCLNFLSNQMEFIFTQGLYWFLMGLIVYKCFIHKQTPIFSHLNALFIVSLSAFMPFLLSLSLVSSLLWLLTFIEFANSLVNHVSIEEIAPCDNRLQFFIVVKIKYWHFVCVTERWREKKRRESKKFRVWFQSFCVRAWLLSTIYSERCNKNRKTEI